MCWNASRSASPRCRSLRRLRAHRFPRRLPHRAPRPPPMPSHSRIAGTGRYLPAQVLTNAELATRVATNDEWIRSRTGIEQRHIAADDEATSDLALHASRQALAAAGIAPSDVDLIIVATTTPDMVF